MRANNNDLLPKYLEKAVQLLYLPPQFDREGNGIMEKDNTSTCDLWPAALSFTQQAVHVYCRDCPRYLPE